MAHEAITKCLLNYGLTKSESAAYLLLLEHGPACMQDLCHALRQTRTIMYHTLDRLKEEGLVSVSTGDKRPKYIAAAPDILPTLAAERASKERNLRERLLHILPELKSRNSDLSKRPNIQIYEGKEGLVRAFDETLQNAEKKVRVMASAEDVSGLIPTHMVTYMQQRAKLGIKMYGIHPYRETSKKLLPHIPPTDLAFFIPPSKYMYCADVAIFDNKVSCMSPTRGGFTISIESKHIVDGVKNIFDLAFEQAKKIDVRNDTKEAKKKRV